MSHSQCWSEALSGLLAFIYFLKCDPCGKSLKDVIFSWPFHNYPRKIQILVLEHYEKRDGVRYYIISLLIAMSKQLRKAALERKVLLGHSLRLRPSLWRRPWCQKLEAAGHKALVVRMHIEVNAGPQLSFSCFFCLGLQTTEWCHPP